MDEKEQMDHTSVSRSAIEGQVRTCYGRVVYTHKTHEKAADILLTRLGRIKLAQIVLSALTTAGFIGAVFGAGKGAAFIGVVVSTVLLILNAYVKDYDLGELAQKHRQSANDLWIIRERYLSLITDIRIGDSPTEDLRERRDVLVQELHSVYESAPSSDYKAYKQAQEALLRHEEMTFSESEIDAFLQRELKKG